MLGRRQIREKVVETVYTYHQNPKQPAVLEKNMMLEIRKIYDLYVYQLNFLVALRQLAERQIAINKNKYLKTEENLNPNLKFVTNQVLHQIEENKERIDYTAKHKELVWDLDDDLLVRTFQRIIVGKRYQDFMQESGYNFADDQKFIGKLYLRYIAENDDFHSHFEDKEISWADDFHIANSMVQKTISFLKEDGDNTTLIKVIKDEEDENFATQLLQVAIEKGEENQTKINDRLKNWELDRISLVDKIILITAIAELDHFPQTASRIIINEYVEIAKIFGTEKSNIFVNGILDAYIKDTNRIN